MRGFGENNKSRKIKSSNFQYKYDDNQILKEAIKYHYEGDLLQASKLYKFLIDKGSKNSTIFTNYGLILINRRKLKEAEFYIKKAIQLNPKDHIAYSNLGGLLKDRKKLKEAEFFIRKAIEIDPKDYLAHSNLGSLLKDLGMLEEAEKSLLKAIEINPKDFIAHSILGGVLRDLGKLEEAEKSLFKAIEINPKDYTAHSILGGVLRDLGKLDEAEKSLIKAIEINPKNYTAHSILGGVLRDLGKLDEAEKSLIKAIEINPKNYTAHSIMGAVLRDLGKLDEAEKSLIKAIEINPNSGIAYFFLSKFRASTKDKNWQQYLLSAQILNNQKESDLIDIYFARANVLERNLKYKESSKMLIKANTLNRKIYSSNYIRIKNQMQYYFKIWQNIERKKFLIKDQLASIFIVGLPRSGKTITESILSCNKALLKCGEGNALSLAVDKYLSKTGLSSNKDLYQLYIENIAKQISNESYICSTTPGNYLFTGLIASQIDNSKVVYCFRNPLDHIKELYSRNIKNEFSFRTSIVESANILLSINELMEDYKSIFNSKIYLLNYDSLVVNPEKEIRSLLSWLGWKYEEKYLFPQLDPTTSIKSENLDDNINSKYLNIWKNYKKLLQPAIEIISSNNKYRHLIF